jgi:hypothetical protein
MMTQRNVILGILCPPFVPGLVLAGKYRNILLEGTKTISVCSLAGSTSSDLKSICEREHLERHNIFFLNQFSSIRDNDIHDEILAEVMYMSKPGFMYPAVNEQVSRESSFNIALQ